MGAVTTDTAAQTLAQIEARTTAVLDAYRENCKVYRAEMAAEDRDRYAVAMRGQYEYAHGMILHLEAATERLRDQLRRLPPPPKP